MMSIFCEFLAKVIVLNQMYHSDISSEDINNKIKEVDLLIDKLTISQIRASVKLMILLKINKESWELRR